MQRAVCFGRVLLLRRLLCSFQRPLRADALALGPLDRFAQGVVLPLGVQLIQSPQLALCTLERAAAGRLVPLSGARRRRRGRQPRQVADDDRLDFARHHTPVGAIFVVHQMGLGLVPRVADQLIARVAPFLVAHFRPAVAADQQAGEQLAALRCTRLVPPVQAAHGARKGLLVDQRLVPPGVALALVDDHARVALPQQDLPHQMLVFQSQLAGNPPCGLPFQIARVDLAHRVRVAVGHQDALGRVVVVAKGDLAAARPEPLLDALDHAHARTQKDVFALELGKGGQDADHRAAVRAAGVDVLVDRNKVHAVRQEHVLDQVERILLAAAQAVKLVDHHPLDRAAPDRFDQLGHRRAGQVGAGKAAVHIAPEVRNALHAAVGLELFRLRGERVALVRLRFGRYAQI